MSFLSLLKLGSGMPKVKAMGRYNLAKQATLPTFGPNKKTQSIGEKVAEAQAKAEAEARTLIPEMPATPKPVAASPEIARSVAAKLEARQSAVSRPAPKKKGFGLGWLGKANPFAGGSGDSVAPAPIAAAPIAVEIVVPVTVAKPTVAQPVAQSVAAKLDKPMQAELSLDKVKVVRNDLSDADLEVIPTGTKKPKAPPGSSIPDKRYVRPTDQPDQLGKKAWGLLGNRLFGPAATKHN